jgi:sulfide:quinone oxidoreductase
MILPRHHIEFLHAKATHLDAKEQVLTLQKEIDDGRDESSVLNYDYLVIATIPRLAFEEIPGLNELHHSNQHDPPHDVNSVVSICTTDHATHAARMVNRLVQNPGLGATQGASCFGPSTNSLFVAELFGEKGWSGIVVKPVSPIFADIRTLHWTFGSTRSGKVRTNLDESTETKEY